MADEEFTVKCVRPTGEEDEVSRVQTAYNIMLENGFNPIWVESSDCLSVKEKERNCVFVIDPFTGEAFDHLSSLGCRIFGPQCVLSCLHLKVEIPKTRLPIYSLAMKDLMISCTGLDSKAREDVMCYVQWMGGKVQKAFTDHVTHLVAGDVGNKKYIVAGRLGKHIMTTEWVDQVWLKGKDRHLHGTDEQFQKYKCPIFKNMVVTVSGLDSEKRKQVKSLVEAEGGKYSGEMKVNECSHLIIKEPKGQKYEFARKWKIQIVTLKWLTESVEKGYSQEEDQYRVESSSTQRPAVSTSTPEKGKEKGQRFSTMGDISCISLPDVSHLNETTMLNMTRLSMGAPIDLLLELDLSKFTAHLFLDGCKIYLSGFRGVHLEKLRKIINMGGATRFNQLSENVSHVVLGEKIESDLNALRQASFRPHVVTPTWLIDSLKQGKQLDEKNYSCLEIPSMASSSSVPKVVKRPSVDKSVDVEKNNRTEDDDREMADLLSQYMRPENDLTLQAEDQTTMVELVENNEELTQQPDEEDCEGLFGGKKFVFFGFEDDQQTELGGYIEENGGKVLSGTSRKICDYAVVPIGGFPVSVTVTQVVTNAWLQMCLEQDELLTVSSNELFEPVEIVEESSPLTGCVLSVSGFAGTERDCLMHIAEVLGARCQEYFVRKANNKDNKGLEASTHLITKEAEGSKYTAAKKWKLPAVSKAWLFACARSGRRESEENYLIENVLAAQPQQTSPALSKTDQMQTDKKLVNNVAATTIADRIQNCTESDKNKNTTDNQLDTNSEGNKVKRDAINSDNNEEDLSHKPVTNNDLVSKPAHGEFEEEISKPEERVTLPQTSPTVQGRRSSAHVSTPGGRPASTAHMSPPGRRSTSSAHISPPEGRSGPTAHISPREGRSAPTAHISPPAGRSAPTAHISPPAGRSASTTHISPPGSSSQKENIGNTHVTPCAPRPPHGRVKELLGAGHYNKVTHTPRTAAQLGIDTPSKFLKPGQVYHPNYDFTEFLTAVKSPTTPAGSKKTARRRQSSLGLDEALEFNLSQGMKITSRKRDDSTVNNGHHGIEDQGDALETQGEDVGPLRDVVIAVSKKLGTHQAEYNNMAASLGADYRWTYDKSCTHFIFQGRPNDINKEFRTAREQGKIIVSPYWLTVCKEQNAHVEESLFPHNYNPNLTLSVVTSKRDTPRSTRKSARSTLKSQSEEQAKKEKPRLRSTTTENTPVKPTKIACNLVEKHFSTGKPSIDTISDDENHPTVTDENTDQHNLPDGGGTLEIREAFNKELESIMATTKTKKTARRKSRRLNSSGQTDGENSSTESINKGRSSAKAKQPSPAIVVEERRGSGHRRSRRSSKQSDPGHSEPSQSVQVTWEDETGRLEQERLAVELQRAHSPTQCSEGYTLGEEFDEHAQYSDADKDDSLEVQLNIKTNTNKSSPKKCAEFRTPTPEPPALGFPIAQTNQKIAEPVEIIEYVREAPEAPPSPPPVFIVSGMQRQERDDYGALVEELGGRMLDGMHYDSSCTHLVVGNPTRNEKFLACVASGKWVLHKSYFEACRQEGRFVQEEVHEWGSDGTRSILASSSALSIRLAVAAHRWRIRIHDNVKANQTCKGAFEGWRVVLCTDKSKDENFKRLLEAGGAQVVVSRPPFSSSLDVTHAFLDIHKISIDQGELERLLAGGVKCLRPDYIAAFLTEDPSPNPNEYCPTEVMALKASMSVPEQGVRKRKSSSTSDASKKSRRL